MATSALGMIGNVLSICILCKKEHFPTPRTKTFQRNIYFSGNVDRLQQASDISLSGGPPVPTLHLCHQSPGHSRGQSQSDGPRARQVYQIVPTSGLPAGSAHQPLPGAGVSLSPRALHQRLPNSLLHHRETPGRQLSL